MYGLLYLFLQYHHENSSKYPIFLCKIWIKRTNHRCPLFSALYVELELYRTDCQDWNKLSTQHQLTEVVVIEASLGSSSRVANTPVGTSNAVKS